MRSFSVFRQSFAALSTFGVINHSISHADASIDDIQQQRSLGKVKQPTFGNSANVRTKSEREKRNLTKTKDSKILLLSGSGHPQLSKKVADLIDVELGTVKLGRFMDGEVNVRVDSELRGKHVYIIQSCAAPVNDNAMELLLMTSCVRRCGASRITAVIPYFGYKHHRKATPVSNKHQSRFLTSGAMDFAKMLEVMEVDSVVAVDIQRPGQGQEACYFSAHVPLECVVTRKLFVDHLTTSVLDLESGKQIIVVAPNAESLRRATKYQVDIQNRIWELQELHRIESKIAGKSMTNTALMNHPGIRIVGFFGEESGSGYENNAELLGKAKISGADVVVVDDIVDSASSVVNMATLLKDRGASNIYVCASHGLFTNNACEKIRRSCIDKVIVTDTLPMPPITNDKIEQLSVAPLLAKVILAEHYRRKIHVDTYDHDM